MKTHATSRCVFGRLGAWATHGSGLRGEGRHIAATRCAFRTPGFGTGSRAEKTVTKTGCCAQPRPHSKVTKDTGHVKVQRLPASLPACLVTCLLLPARPCACPYTYLPAQLPACLPACSPTHLPPSRCSPPPSRRTASVDVPHLTGHAGHVLVQCQVERHDPFVRAAPGALRAAATQPHTH